MTSETPHLSRLLNALYRRAVLLHVAERAGLGLLSGSVAAVILCSFLWWIEKPAFHWTILTLAGGLVLGLCWGIFRRPSLLNAAVRADEQLHTDDLLATATSFGLGGDPWQQSIARIADHQSRLFSPSSVVLHRLGGRMWGVIVLSTCIAIVAAALASSGGGSSVPSGDDKQPNASASRRSPGVDRPLIVLAPDSPLLPQSGGRAVEDPPAGEREPIVALAPPQTQPQSTTRPEAADTTGSASAANPDGTGDGAGKAMAPALATRPAEVAGNPVTRPEAAATGPSTKSAGGAGVASERPAGEGPSGIAGAANGAVAAAPWETGQATRGSEAAKAQLDSGRVPADRRDLVRKYFDLE